MCIIELNPFGPQTGALLFDWQRDALILAGWWPRPVFRTDQIRPKISDLYMAIYGNDIFIMRWISRDCECL